ncbi:MAG TPA: hypothetical protein VMJ34_00435 [Bryobacteraceae bacterium]|nr:hypothetical protein [Bryobacteraceae bacterium]
MCGRVQLRASLLTDCMHGVVLVARGCARGMVPEERPGHPFRDAFFDDACSQGREEQRTATFTGQFAVRIANHRIHYILYVERIEDVSIRRIPNPLDHPVEFPPPPVINPEPMTVLPYPEVLRPIPPLPPIPHV